ncbi:hypothetical protein DENSPDRAFT_843875 [Dentipellis sp. KUC8613]|nr:hypothetical protein DENSPDRAFT_843875 [Dentipellis sp. KUC8613]
MSTLPPFNSTTIRATEAPHPEWKVGEGLSRSALGSQWEEEVLKEGWKSWDMASTTPRDAYRILSSAVVPRPVAFISTEAADGVRNLALFSFFNVVSNNPPLLSISFTWSRDGANAKDTRHNIVRTKQFVVNLISEPFIEAANATAVDAPPEFDEWKVAGLTPEPSVSVKPARVKESAVSFECELYSFQDIFPDGADSPSATLVLGRVKHAHVRRAVLDGDEPVVDPAKYQVVGRLSGRTYARVGDTYDLARPDWREAV